MWEMPPARWTITQAHLKSDEIPHWRLYQQLHRRPVYEVNIASHARAETVCSSTLPLLQAHGVDMSRVSVFIDFDWKNDEGVDACTLYSQCLRRNGFHTVHVRRGGAGLEGNMRQAFALFELGTYVITMSDKVDDVLEFVKGVGRHGRTRPLAKGALLAIWHHAYDLIRTGGYAAWSTSASHSLLNLHDRMLSQKAGMTGQIATVLTF